MNTTLRRLSLFVLIISQIVTSSPVPYNSKQAKSDKDRVLYDQRQEGEWNIRADLKNFIIMIIPKSPEVPEPSPGASLLDLFTRSHPKHHHAKHHKATNTETNNEVAAETTMHFIESKTAPYHVDITKSKNHLMNEEILATQSPPVPAITLKAAASAPAASEPKPKPNADQLLSVERSISPSVLRQLRSKAFVLTVPEDDFVLTEMEDEKKVVKKDGLKKKTLKKPKEEMTLLGAAEQCGPDMVRDTEGVCRLKNVVDINENNESSRDRDE